MRAPVIDQAIEPERYELFELGAPFHSVTRRRFLQAVGGGVVVLLVAGDAKAMGNAVVGGGPNGDEPEDRGAMADAIGVWLHIAGDGAVTVYTGKVEIGQDVRTSLAQIVAEELHAPLASIRLVMGDTDLTPFDQGTFGSRTTPQMGSQLRTVSAAAREVLIGLAAARWSVGREALNAADGRIVDSRASRSLSFGELTKGEKILQEIAAGAATTPAAQWRVAGTSAKRVNAHDIVTGTHRYSADIVLPGMLYGKVVRPSAIGATLDAFNADAARRLPGVTVVRDGDFAGVVAASEHEAVSARAAVQATWKTTPQTSATELFDYLRKNTTDGGATGESGGGGGRGGGGGASRQARGSMEAGLAEAATKLDRSYTVAYIAHVPLEPRAAVAQWVDGKVTVWTGTQRPFGVRTELAQAFAIPEERVRVIVPDTGSGYGGKHTGDAAIEAARLSREAGKPVKLVWTRDEEFTWAYFRPAGVIDVKSGARADGTLTAWEYHNYNSGTSGLPTPYVVPNQTVAFHPTRTPLRQGSYRGLAATANHFARETHMNELAHELGMDPLAFRLKNLTDTRVRAALEAAADAFGWGKTLPAGHGAGIAGGTEKGGYVATCAEVAVDASGVVRLVRLVTSFECGAIVNPDGLKNQVEGSVIMGIGGALFEAIDFQDGVITNGRLARYRVPRFSDVPEMKTVLIDRKDIPSAGAGETPIFAVAPAIAAGIFGATGVRLSSLPLAPNGVKRG
jgi:isoquinoline 1-oxidoreductase